MKTLTEYFSSKNTIFSSFEEISPKELKSRKKLNIFCALDTNKNYYAIFRIDSKSRFIQKNAKDLIELLNTLISYKEHNFKYKYLFISSDICSKSMKLLEENNWKVVKK